MSEAQFVARLGKGRARKVPAAASELERISAAIEPTTRAFSSSVEERVMDGSCYMVTVRWHGTVRQFGAYLGDARTAELIGERERELLMVLEAHLESGR